MSNICDAQGRRPLLLSPAFKDYIWGGNRLKRDWGKRTDMTPLAESWELSCHEAGLSVIAEGAYAGRTLGEYLAEHPQDAGTKAQNAGAFPLLIKLIDAAGPLSVQVHPDDAYAREFEHSLGKSEMWLVLDASEGAGIYYGFKRETPLAEMRAAIENNTLTELLNWVPAKTGDCFFIPAGTVHAIGAGLMVAEVQQSSNLTYRVYDYGRVGADGRPRDLHIDKALAVARRAAERPRRPDRTGARRRGRADSAAVFLRQVYDGNAHGGGRDGGQRIAGELCFAAGSGGRRRDQARRRNVSREERAERLPARGAGRLRADRPHEAASDKGIKG